MQRKDIKNILAGCTQKKLYNNWRKWYAPKGHSFVIKIAPPSNIQDPVEYTTKVLKTNMYFSEIGIPEIVGMVKYGEHSVIDIQIVENDDDV